VGAHRRPDHLVQAGQREVARELSRLHTGGFVERRSSRTRKPRTSVGAGATTGGLRLTDLLHDARGMLTEQGFKDCALQIHRDTFEGSNPSPAQGPPDVGFRSLLPGRALARCHRRDSRLAQVGGSRGQVTIPISAAMVREHGRRPVCRAQVPVAGPWLLPRPCPFRRRAACTCRQRRSARNPRARRPASKRGPGTTVALLTERRPRP
jgi:hypothetical protein